SGVLVVLSLVPGLPKLSFIFMAIALAMLARRVKDAVPAPEAAEAGAAKAAGKAPAEPMETALKLDEISLEVGYGLVAMVDEAQGGQLLRRIRALRKHLATQRGFIV